MRHGPYVSMIFFLVICFFPSIICAGPVPDTGQTKCYNDSVEIPCPNLGEAFYGQDANYNINTPSYTKLDASGHDLPDTASSWAMVRDNITGLIWEVKINKDGTQDYSNPNDADNLYTWYDSSPETNGGDAGTPGNSTDTMDYISALNSANFGGYSDWRLPTVRELQHIVDTYGENFQFYTAYFPNTVYYYYWSSNSLAAEYAQNYAWRVGFGNGHVESTEKSGGQYVRAVRSGMVRQTNEFVNNGDGTVTDARTGLMWEQKTNDEGPNDKDLDFTWSEALSWIAFLNASDYLGYSDWRLPNIRELASIIDFSRHIPSIDTNFFPNTQTSSYWSSTTDLFPVSNAWNVFFGSGDISWNSKSGKRYARAVRSGQSRTMGYLFISTPIQGSIYGAGDSVPIIWETEGLDGDASILLSRDGGKTYTNIITATPNDGSFNWVITGPESANCMLKVIPTAASSKETIQGLFSIIDLLPGDVNNSGIVDVTDALLSMQTTAGITTLQAIYSAADINGDAQIGHQEGVYALRTASEIFQIWYEDADGDQYSNGTSLTQGFRPEGYYSVNELISTSGDCNDNNALIYPDAVEICGDGVDQDCNGGDLDCSAGVTTGYWDLYVPQVSPSKVDGYFFDVTGTQLTGASLLGAPITGSVNGTAVQFTDANGGSFQGTWNGQIIDGAESLFSASSKLNLVRVEFSKNRLAMVISRNEGTFFIGLLITSLNC